MQCAKCQEKAVIELQHGVLCKKCFLDHFEQKVFRTIREFNLIEENDTVCVAASGGKDSSSMLYILKKFCARKNIPFFALAIDEGITDYRTNSIALLTKFCEQKQIVLRTASFKKEIGFSMDEIIAIMKERNIERNPCSACGVFRRYLLNKGARELGATKLVTGHNLDDESQAFLMNMIKTTTAVLPNGGPISGAHASEKFVPRIKPFYFCAEKETKMYALLKEFPISSYGCPNARQGFRTHLRRLVNDFEAHHPGTKSSLLRSYLNILPAVREAAKHKKKISYCRKCGEPCAGETCKACQFLELIC